MQIEVSQIPHRYRNRFLRDNNGSVTVNKSTSKNNSAASFQPVNIWGQYFDDTEDISGDLSGVGSIRADGSIYTSSDVICSKLFANDVSSTSINADSISADTADITTVNATTADITNVSADTISADTAVLSDISANTADITNVSADTIKLPTWTIDEDSSHNINIQTANDTSFKVKPHNTEVININDDNISFNTNLSTYNFASGLSGWKIFSNGNAEFQNIKVNGSFDAYSITYNNIRATNGIMLVTDTGCITAVEEKTISGTKYWIFTISEYPPFAQYDYVLLQYKVNSTTIKKFKGSVAAINQDGTNTVRVAPFSSEYTVDVDTAVGQYLIRVGNYSNANRQTVIKLNPYDGGYIDFLKDLNSAAKCADEDSIVNQLPTACRIGNLSGITYNTQSLSGYGLYAENAYLTGAIGNLNNKWRLNNDGSGQIANNHIYWDASGNLTIKLNNDKEIEQYISDTVDESVDDSLKNIEGEIDGIKNDYVTKTDFNVTTRGITSRVSAIEGDYVTESELQQTANGITTRVAAIEDDYVTESELNQTASGITTRVSAIEGDYVTESELQQTASGITTRVSAIEGDYVTESELQQTANGITTRVAAIEDDYVTESELNQTASGITTRVSAIENDYVTESELNQTANGITTRVAAIEDDYVTESELNQTASGITTRVSAIEGDYVNQSQLQQTATGINARVDNLKVGGTNLLLGTQNFNTSGTNLTLWSSATVGPDKRNDCTVLHCPLDTSAVYSDAALWSNITIDPDTYYTLSFYAFANDNNTQIDSYFYRSAEGCVAEGYNSQGRTTTSADGGITTYLSQSPTRYWVVWKTISEVGQPKTLIPARLKSNSSIHIWGVKFEKGNMATDWSPSPDEYATHAEISVEADNIKLAVYNELNESTGINVSDGTITLDADNTTIVGNLNLTDTNNGLTVYDPDEVGRVYLQPDSINSRCTSVCDGGTMTYQTISKTVTGQSNCTVTLDKLTMNNPGADKVFNLSNFNVLQYTGQSTIRTPSSLIIKIYKDNTVVKTETVSLKSNGTGFYITNPEDYCFTYTFLDNSTYQLEITVNNYTSISTSLSLFTMVNAKHQYGGKVETYIGQNGLYCHSAANKHLLVNEKKIELRNELSGFRLSSSDPYNDTNNFGRLEVLAAYRGNLPNITPVWLPFWNYTPLCIVGTNPRPWNNGTIVATGQNKYYYEIKPAFDSGIFIITDPPFDSSLNIVNEAWVVLPPIDNFDKDGNSFTLPRGYTVTIVNNTFGSNACNVYVCPGEYGTKIIDANRNINTYSNLVSIQTNDTFIYCEEYNNTPYWRQLHDTQ